MKDEDARSDQAGDGSSGTTQRSAEDRWTQGPEIPPQSGSQQAGQPDDDADTLRERQRLAQLEMMDHWIGGVLAEQRRSRRWKLFFRLLMLSLLALALGLGIYQFYMPSSATPTTQPHLGRVEVNGVIAEDAPANAERIIEGLRNAWDAEAATAVVLHINSPGGSPVQSQRIYSEIMRLRESGDKPIVAVVEDIGASGAYYIAAAADEIVASPVSLVGSIGVIYSGFGLQEAIDRLGVERRVLTAGDNKAFLDPFQPLDDDAETFWQGVLNSTHQQFVSDVKAGRGDRLSDDDSLFTGLIWSGEQAQALGLVDQLGSIDDVARHYVDGAHWQDYTPSLDPFDRLARRFTRTAVQLMGVDTSPSPLSFQSP
ncbi:signal peptide peptidase SppA [Vreelandella arcis]|uniref:Protease-4 n=1 Tax=Vreelandella arcis TaxID=416873 RepID=A0A1G9ZN33_9GAMM|nr:signal peptide peptidase SppA [Halomonas arcis]SDN22644.1 protease-4 [Halomonas arcis]